MFKNYLRVVLRKQVRKTDELFWVNQPGDTFTVTHFMKCSGTKRVLYMLAGLSCTFVCVFGLVFLPQLTVDVFRDIFVHHESIFMNSGIAVFFTAMMLFAVYYIPINVSGILWSLKHFGDAQLKRTKR